jgi:hypothetical protein
MDAALITGAANDTFVGAGNFLNDAPITKSADVADAGINTTWFASHEAVGNTSITKTGSPMTITNASQFTRHVSVFSGGTVSLITATIGGVSIGVDATSGIFPLAPGDSIQVTYSGGGPTLRLITGLIG